MGRLVKERVKELGRTTASVAREMNIERQTMHDVYRRQTISLDQLVLLCRVLKKDFFEYYREVLYTETPELKQEVGLIKVEDPVTEYMTGGSSSRLIIDFKDGLIENVQSSKTGASQPSSKLEQLEQRVEVLTSALRERGLNID